MLRRRFCLSLPARLVSLAAAGAGVACAAPAPPASRADPAAVLQEPRLRRLVVLDVELVDEQLNPHTVDAQTRRLADATAQLRRVLAARSLYQVIDASPADALLSTLRSQHAFVYRCDDCAAQVGRQLGAERVMVAWVQKVSELILNFNVQIFDVTAGRVSFSKSVDLRGNNDVSWGRAIDYLVRDMAEKRALNPRYAN